MIKRVKIQTAKLVAYRVSCFLHLHVVASLAVILSCMFLFPSFATSEIYKWKDSNGNVIFSDSPQSGSNVEEVRLKKDSRFERPPSREDDVLKTGQTKKAATEPRVRDARDINVALYMTDW
jgi:hypothetical protein